MSWSIRLDELKRPGAAGLPLAATRLLLLAVLAAPSLSAQAAIRILAVGNAASFSQGLPAQGSLATIFCTGISDVAGVVVADRLPLPLELAGVGVRIRGVPAPILAVAAADGFQQINIQTPWEGGVGMAPDIELTQGAEQAQLETAGRSGWGAFFSDSRGVAVVQHAADFSLVSAENPARRGEIVVAYATGLGAVEPPLLTGFPAPSNPLSWLMGSVAAVSLDGRIANTLFRGLAPGLVGVYQVNFQIPESAAAGDLPLSFSVTSCPPFGSCGSPFFAEPVTTFGPSVTIPVQ